MVIGCSSRLFGPVALANEPRSVPENGSGEHVAPARCERAPVALREPSVPAPPAGELPDKWFREHFSRLWRLVARLGVARESIDDVVQDTFITASRRRADIREGSEWPFLVGTAVRLGANYRVRAAARREVMQGELLDHTASTLPDAEHLLIEKRLRQELERALSTLSKAHRSVFVLYELEGFSVPQIADMLGVPLGTVASRLGRARATFSRTAARMQRARLTCQEDP